MEQRFSLAGDRPLDVRGPHWLWDLRLL